MLAGLAAAVDNPEQPMKLSNSSENQRAQTVAKGAAGPQAVLHLGWSMGFEQLRRAASAGLY